MYLYALRLLLKIFKPLNILQIHLTNLRHKNSLDILATEFNGGIIKFKNNSYLRGTIEVLINIFINCLEGKCNSYNTSQYNGKCSQSNYFMVYLIKMT